MLYRLFFPMCEFGQIHSWYWNQLSYQDHHPVQTSWIKIHIRVVNIIYDEIEPVANRPSRVLICNMRNTRDAFTLQMRKTRNTRNVNLSRTHPLNQNIRSVIGQIRWSYRGQQRLHLCALILHVHLLYLWNRASACV